MQLWIQWLDTIQAALQLFSNSFGLGVGAAIILLTIMLRIALLPVSWSSAYRGTVHRKKMQKLQPEIQRLGQRFGERPDELAAQTLRLYRARGVSMFEGRTILGAVLQMPVMLGMFQALRSGVEAVRFLWVSSLAKPDVLLAILAGITTALMIAANPDMPEQTRILLVIVPSIIAFIFALKFASALALYWVTSNLFTAIQTSAVHFVIGQRMRNGKLVI